jgi:hypothetical protein
VRYITPYAGTWSVRVGEGDWVLPNPNDPNEGFRSRRTDIVVVVAIVVSFYGAVWCGVECEK